MKHYAVFEKYLNEIWEYKGMLDSWEKVSIATKLIRQKPELIGGKVIDLETDEVFYVGDVNG